MNQRLIQPTTLVEILRQRAQNQPLKTAYTFLKDGETEEVSLTYAQLEQRVRAIAAKLQDMVAIGDRALLVYPAGLSYIAAFLGCLYAGVIAVPTYPPRRNRSDNRLQIIAHNRLQIIAQDAQPKIVLIQNDFLSNLTERLTDTPELKKLPWLVTDKVTTELADTWQTPSINSDTLAVLQYTSGSTGAPKGVMVSHGNLLYNEEMIRQGFGHTENAIGVGWLPLFHDMGLIGNLLQSLYLGIPCIMMSPIAFLQKPLRWLKAISHYKATTSGGPNFAYELACQKITPKQREKLDLSRWELAFSGAEPIRAETLEKFAATFEPCGFRREAFYPCYGMAETTLFVSGGLKTAPPIVYEVEKAALELNRVLVTPDGENTQKIVSCGQTWLDQKIVIVDPETFISCSEQQVGEIWVSGQNVAQGYWNRPKETEQTFHAYLANTGEGPFLRTGDLGFLKNGELFVTGRLKDLIIIRGRNYYPQDIELIVEKAHPVLKAGNGAAFSVEKNGEERLIIAQEVQRTSRRNLNVNEVVNAIRQAFFEQYALGIEAVLLLKTGSLPKTSSGKIQRHACRAGFLANSLELVGEWHLPVIEQTQLSHSKPSPYPFGKERYWIPVVEPSLKTVGDDWGHVAKLHPLLESNTSTFRSQQFTTRLTGKEFYLADHIVVEQKTLPGVAYLEMARAAGELAGEKSVMRLSNIVWSKPIIVSDTPRIVHMSLYPNQQQVEFEVTNLDDKGEQQIHAQGKLTYFSQAVRDSKTVDIEAIKNRCPETLNRAECYKLFQTIGLNYGPSFQTIQALYHNETEALSHLQLPSGLKDGCKDFVLHPSLMNGALQTVIGLINQERSGTAYIPFALGDIELFNPLSDNNYVFVHRAGSSQTTDASVNKFNILMTDETGQVLVRLTDFSVQPFAVSQTPATMGSQVPAEKGPLLEKIQKDLLNIVATILKFDAKNIDLSNHITEYGFDSINLPEFANCINQKYQLEITPAIFVEYPSLGTLSQFLFDEYKEHFISKNEVLAAKIDKLSEEEVDSLLKAEMASKDELSEEELEPKRELLKRLLRERANLPTQCVTSASANVSDGQTDKEKTIPQRFYRFELFPEYQQICQRLSLSGGEHPYFRVHESAPRNTVYINGQEYLNYSSYNYLGLCGDERVTQAAKEALDRYGTSVSASRVASGEIPLHRNLESALADLLNAEDSIVFIGGFTTNETTIGHLFGPKDLLLHDELIHNSIIQGCLLSGAHRLPFPHNNWQKLDRLLEENRCDYERVLIIIEGVYSMDGDIPDLPKFIQIKKRHKAFLMVDEAHSIGVLGQHGFGIREHFGINGEEVDLWMGTLSKSFASCGGYIAGCKELVEYLKYTSPGFVYSVGMPPANAAAALAAISILRTEPERVARLRDNSQLFLELAQSQGLDTGLSKDSPVVPVIVGNSALCLKLALALFELGIDAPPIVYPAVEESAARVRFFISCTHTKEQIRYTVNTVASLLEKLRKEKPQEVCLT